MKPSIVPTCLLTNCLWNDHLLCHIGNTFSLFCYKQKQRNRISLHMTMKYFNLNLKKNKYITERFPLKTTSITQFEFLSNPTGSKNLGDFRPKWGKSKLSWAQSCTDRYDTFHIQGAIPVPNCSDAKNVQNIDICGPYAFFCIHAK